VLVEVEASGSWAGRHGEGGGSSGRRQGKSKKRTLALMRPTKRWRRLSNDPSALMFSRTASVSADDDAGTFMPYTVRRASRLVSARTARTFAKPLFLPSVGRMDLLHACAGQLDIGPEPVKPVLFLHAQLQSAPPPHAASTCEACRRASGLHA